jgi:hypothetical protein
VASVPLPHQFTVAEAVTSANINTYYSAISFLENPPIAILYQSGSVQAVANNTDVALQLNNTVIDTYGGHSNSTNNTRYTAQVAGYYQVMGTGSLQVNGVGGRLVRLRKNGSTEIPTSAAEQPPSSDFNCVMSTPSVQLFLAVNDYVEVVMFQDSGGSLNTVTTTQYASGLQIRWVHV